MISLGQNNTLAEYMILYGADNRPPMLDKDLYESWKSGVQLYIQNREHERMILESVKHGPLIWPMIKENRTSIHLLIITELPRIYGREFNYLCKTKDLDTYDSEYDDISNAKEILMDKISNYGYDVISEEKIALKEKVDSLVTDINKRTKSKLQPDKTEHEMESVEKSKANQVKVKDGAKELLNGPTRTHLMGQANNLPRSEFIVTLIREFIEIDVIVKLLSLSLSTFHDRLCHLAILCLDHHAHTLHHLENFLTISLERIDILKEDLVYQSLRKSLSLCLSFLDS
uniref:Uncharacterized protein n=1 Tax=Tanacetum cinerariifolium TaxID=118510 RepID=A0A6L2KKT5_TANCI|nr:hypothetical protein [Tanacetum cinerariifolium]